MEQGRPRRTASVTARPSQADLVLPPSAADQHAGPEGAHHPYETPRSRKVSFGSSAGGRTRHMSASSSEAADYLVPRARRSSVLGGDTADRSRKVSVSRRTLSSDERGWGTEAGGTAAGRGVVTSSVPKQNTYKTGPDRPFSERPVREVIQAALAEVSGAQGRYTGAMSGKARSLSDAVRQRVRALGFDRYKIVCVVCLGQKKGQTVRDVGRCLWDPEKDGFVSVTYENAALFAIVSVYAVYQE